MIGLNLIVACSRNRVIGRDGHLPWRIREDLAYYRACVRGGIIIQGRRSFAEVGRPMKRTRTLVLTSQSEPPHAKVEIAGSLEAALDRVADQSRPVWICGGAQVYAEALPLASRLYLTQVEAEVEGDTFFPDWTGRFTRLIRDEPHRNADFAWRYQVWEVEGAGES